MNADIKTATPRSLMNGKPVFMVPSRTVINLKSHFKEKLLVAMALLFTAGSGVSLFLLSGVMWPQ